MAAAKFFLKLPLHMKGLHKDMWRILVAGTPQTINSFKAKLKIFKNRILEGFDYKTQMECIWNLKKPLKMNPNLFIPKPETAYLHAAQIPNTSNNGGLLSDQFKRVYL